MSTQLSGLEGYKHNMDGGKGNNLFKGGSKALKKNKISLNIIRE